MPALPYDTEQKSYESSQLHRNIVLKPPIPTLFFNTTVTILEIMANAPLLSAEPAPSPAAPSLYVSLRRSRRDVAGSVILLVGEMLSGSDSVCV